MINKIQLAKLLNFLEDNNFDLENLETNENTIKLEISDSNQLKIHRVDEKERYIFKPEDFGFILTQINKFSTAYEKRNDNKVFLLSKSEGCDWKIEKYIDGKLVLRENDLVFKNKDNVSDFFKEIGVLEKEKNEKEWFFNPLDYGFEYDKNENYFIKQIRAVNGATLRAFIMRTKEREPNKNWYFEEQDKIQNTTRPYLFTEITKSYIEHELKKYGVI